MPAHIQVLGLIPAALQNFIAICDWYIHEIAWCLQNTSSASVVFDHFSSVQVNLLVWADLSCQDPLTVRRTSNKTYIRKKSHMSSKCRCDLDLTLAHCLFSFLIADSLFKVCLFWKWAFQSSTRDAAQTELWYMMQECAVKLIYASGCVAKRKLFVSIFKPGKWDIWCQNQPDFYPSSYPFWALYMKTCLVSVEVKLSRTLGFQNWLFCCLDCLGILFIFLCLFSCLHHFIDRQVDIIKSDCP